MLSQGRVSKLLNLQAHSRPPPVWQGRTGRRAVLFRKPGHPLVIHTSPADSEFRTFSHINKFLATFFSAGSLNINLYLDLLTFLFAKQTFKILGESRVRHLGRANENLHLEVSVQIQLRLKEPSGSLNATALKQFSGLVHLFLTG